ncbi:hypothetical protein [Pandoraea sputorum]|uniref:hypothetical protein n=1 Tax=Pandoraea sputorum TaxID=93222 RepID=UPI0012593736|nr:hypothetical protein [Pandoraea sputorum]BET11822.1 hypothetical protein THI4931_28640 [Pandoraea sputorum]VVE84801.1 hypothetical protein PSP31120_04844 [Pandoraea sputorum]
MEKQEAVNQIVDIPSDLMNIQFWNFDSEEDRALWDSVHDEVDDEEEAWTW